MYYYTVSMLIDWNIKYDIYASLCVVKDCAFAVKMGESRTMCTVLDCITVLIFMKLLEAPPTISGGAVLPTYIGGWLVGEGSQLMKLTLNCKRCLISIYLLYLSWPASCFVWKVFVDSITRAVFLTLQRSEPLLRRALPFSVIHEGHTDNHSLVCQQLTR